MKIRKWRVNGVVFFLGTIGFILLLVMALPVRIFSQSGEDTVIRACTREVGSRKEITMMVIADSCEPGWNPTEWNRQGPQGETGPQGLQGEIGAQGLQGETGTQGSPGPTNISIQFSQQVEVEDGNVETLPLWPSNNRYCALQKVGIWNAEDDSEISFCELYISQGVWQLKAVSNGDSHAGCRAVCFSWP